MTITKLGLVMEDRIINLKFFYINIVFLLISDGPQISAAPLTIRLEQPLPSNNF